LAKPQRSSADLERRLAEYNSFPARQERSLAKPQRSSADLERSLAEYNSFLNEQKRKGKRKYAIAQNFITS
jgi:hypothetical protein